MLLFNTYSDSSCQQQFAKSEAFHTNLRFVGPSLAAQ
jgi:hypothetical protein